MWELKRSATALSLACLICLHGSLVYAEDDEASDGEVEAQETAPEVKPEVAPKSAPSTDRPKLDEPRETLPGMYPENLGTFVGQGFWAGTLDRRYVLRASGFVHLDSRFGFDGDGSTGESNMYWRRVRLTVDGRLPGKFEYRLMWDQMVDPLVPYDFHVDWRPYHEFNVRVGGFKSSFGLERRGRSYALLFIERGFPTMLAPNRDLGVFFYGQTKDSFFSYDVSVVAGAENLGVLFEPRGQPEFAGRVYFLPFRLMPELEVLRHLGIGLSWTVKQEFGTQEATALNRLRATPRRSLYGGRALFEYLSDEMGGTIADGLRDRQSLQLHWQYKQYQAMFEYVRSAQQVSRMVSDGGDSERYDAYLAHHAWQAIISQTFGEKDENTFFGVKPKKPFDLSKGHWGGATASLRYQELSIDPASFGAFADPGWAQTVRALALSLQWHINYQLEVQLDGEYQVPTSFDPARSLLGPEFTVMSRVEVRY
jgi:phosphate-selective porin OprO/OprP